MSIRTGIVLLAFSAPLLANSFVRGENKPVVVREVSNVKTKDAIEAERKKLQGSESEFIKKLDWWIQDATFTIFYLQLAAEDAEKEKQLESARLKLFKANSNFVSTVVGVGKNISEQVKAYNELIDVTDEVAPLIKPYLNIMKVEEIVNNLERNLKKKGRTEEEIKKLKEHTKDALNAYRETVSMLSQEKPKLVQALETFNRIANQAPYKSRLKLSPERLKALKAF